MDRKIMSIRIKKLRHFSYCLLFFVFSWGCSIERKETKDMDARLLWDAKAMLGEGAFWHHGEKRLYWVDIEGKKLHIFDPIARADRAFLLDEKIGTVVPLDSGGGAVVALKNGIHKLDLETEKLRLLVHPAAHEAGNRYNDGKCDPAGRLWVGTIGETGSAALYRINAAGKSKMMIDSVTISNGIVWSKDNMTMYYIDTPTKTVVAYSYDVKTGEISKPKVVVTVPEGMGSPDGMAIDAEDKLWIGHWGGACVARWDPITGNMMRKIEVPALNVTSCAFGGENLDILYITTASIGMNAEETAKYPLSGGLFVADPGVAGVKSYLFKTSVDE